MKKDFEAAEMKVVMVTNVILTSEEEVKEEEKEMKQQS